MSKTLKYKEIFLQELPTIWNQAGQIEATQTATAEQLTLLHNSIVQILSGLIEAGRPRSSMAAYKMVSNLS